MDRVRYVLAVMVVAMIPPAIVWWYVIHPFVDFWRRLGVRTTMWAVGASAMVLMAGLILLRDRLLGADLGTSLPLAVAGLILIVVAMVMGLKRRRFLTQRILAGIPEIQSDDPGTLITEGPYAVIRHPRYVEVLVGILGYALVANFVGAYVVTALSVPALHLVVVLEERELTQRFGAAFEAYRTRVPRYIPRPRSRR